MIHVLNMHTQLRPRLCILVCLCLIKNGIVIGGVWLDHLDFKQVGTGLSGDFFCCTTGITTPGEVGDQHFAVTASTCLNSGACYISGTGRRITHKADTKIKTALILLHSSAVSRAHIFSKIIPTAAAVYPKGTAFRAGGVSLRFGRVSAVIIPYPFTDIPIHIK